MLQQLCHLLRMHDERDVTLLLRGKAPEGGHGSVLLLPAFTSGILTANKELEVVYYDMPHAAHHDAFPQYLPGRRSTLSSRTGKILFVK